MADPHEVRLERAWVSLQGLSVGDALGGFFEFGHPGLVRRYVETRALPGPPWRFTDDTDMALSIFSILRQYGGVEQDALAASFADHYDRTRGYGPGTRGLLTRLQQGMPWREAAAQQFGGQGSYGNGGPMRVAPVGAYFADDLDALALHAARSAEVTHAHPEAIAGAVAVAVATAWAWRLRDDHERPSRPDFIKLVLPGVPASAVRAGIERARDLSPEATVDEAVAVLGNGQRVSAQDTVPFVLWCAGEWLADYEQAIWHTISGLGDADTTCAMVGGIVAAHTGVEGIPPEWIRCREPLPGWPFYDSE